MIDDSNIETSKWLIKGISKRRLQIEKLEALRQIARTEKKKARIKSNCYFDECKNCINREYNDNLLCCLSNRLSLAWHKLFLELPFINKFVSKNKFCNMFEKE